MDMAAMMAEIEEAQGEAEVIVAEDKPQTIHVKPKLWKEHLARVMEAYPFLDTVAEKTIRKAGKTAEEENVVLYAISGSDDSGKSCFVVFYRTGSVTFTNLDPVK